MPPPPRRPNHRPQDQHSQASRPPGRPAAPVRSHDSSAADRGWDPVAAWYDKLVGEAGSDYHRHVILPAALRMLAPQPGEAILDLCCGQGVLVKPLLDAGIGRFTGVDALSLIHI